MKKLGMKIGYLLSGLMVMGVQESFAMQRAGSTAYKFTRPLAPRLGAPPARTLTTKTSPFFGEASANARLGTGMAARVRAAQLQGGRTGFGASAMSPLGQQVRGISVGKRYGDIFNMVALHALRENLKSEYNQMLKLLALARGEGSLSEALSMRLKEFSPEYRLAELKDGLKKISSVSILRNLSEQLKAEIEKDQRWYSDNEYDAMRRKFLAIVDERVRVLAEKKPDIKTDQFAEYVLGDLKHAERGDAVRDFISDAMSDYIIAGLSSEGVASFERSLNSEYFKKLNEMTLEQLTSPDPFTQRLSHIQEAIQHRKDRLKEESKGFLENMRDWYYGTKNPRPVRAAEPSVEPSFYESSGR